MVRPQARLTVPILLVVVVASSCGSGPSKQDVISKWDSICRSTQQRLSTVQVPNVNSPDDLHRFYLAMRTALPIALSELDQLRAVEVPKDDQETVDGILSNLVRAADQLNVAKRDARKGDLKGTERAIKRSSRYTKAAGTAARAYGFQVCGKSSA